MFCLYACMCTKCVPIGPPEWEAMDGCEHVVLIVEPRSSAKGTEGLNIVLSPVPEIYHFQKNK